MIRSLATRDVFAVGCEIDSLQITCKLYCTNPENRRTGEAILVDIDTQEQYSVLLPNLPSNPSYNVEIPLYGATL